MTYTEWRDELKTNLLCVSEAERRRVLDYYAEAYADRREAGFSEREIINDFGAPYDAARRILNENKNNDYCEPIYAEEERRRRDARAEREPRRENVNYAPPPPPHPPAPPVPPVQDYAPSAPPKARGDYSSAFVLLCVIFAIPIFAVVIMMVSLTLAFCITPVAVVAAGAAAMGLSVGAMASGSAAYGFFELGVGITTLGAGIMLCPLFFKLVGLMWKLFNMFFSWLKSLFSGKERVR